MLQLRITSWDYTNANKFHADQSIKEHNIPFKIRELLMSFMQMNRDSANFLHFHVLHCIFKTSVKYYSYNILKICKSDKNSSVEVKKSRS